MITKLGIVFFSVLAAYMAMATLSPRAQRWAPVVGLAGQPFWIAFVLPLPFDDAWHLYVAILAFTAVYLQACLIRWPLTASTR